MSGSVSELAQRLAQNVESVCLTYLSNGRRAGNYWVVGDAQNNPGKSLYVRLNGPDYGPGARGKWTDSATGSHGDLVDLIKCNRGYTQMRDVIDEAQAFLSFPPPTLAPVRRSGPLRVRQGPADAARRLFGASQSLGGTLAERYLRARGLSGLADLPALRFHPRCFYKRDDGGPNLALPALIAAVTDLSGDITGVHRTWLDPAGGGKAAVDTPRRAMGNLLGHAVRFGVAQDVLAAGEGIETVLSLREVLPNLPSAAALSSNHLAAITFPPGLRTLLILRDRDRAGDLAAEALATRAESVGIQLVSLTPIANDFNDDLSAIGSAGLMSHLSHQLGPAQLERFGPKVA